MKITDLQLEDYGIYKNESVQPSQDQLIVVMGENESGKTTLLNFIRDMLFGFKRGNWKGRKGNMAFVRSNGEKYRVFRDGKDSYFTDSKNEKSSEELPQVWWHGLTRSMYEHIFAVGLEDLQGTTLLSDETVKSRFFMLQGGDSLSDVKKQMQSRMNDLLSASSQSKRKINGLLQKKQQLDDEIEKLSAQETRFASLQKRQTEVNRELTEMQASLAKQQEEYRVLGKRLGAWEYYKKAREIKRGLDLSRQVKVFPANGKEQWNKLMGRMKAIHDQKEGLQEKIDAYTPKTKEQIIPWVGLEGELEQLYVDLGQWKQTLFDKEDLQNQKKAWRNEYSRLGYTLPLWDSALNPDEECKSVNWSDASLLAKGVSVRTNELHFWEQREPQVEELPEAVQGKSVIADEKEWTAFENNATRLEEIIHEEADIRKMMEASGKSRESSYTFWFWIGLGCLVVAAASIGAFFAALSGTIALYTAAGCLGAGVFFILINTFISRARKNKAGKLTRTMEELEEERKNISRELPVHAPVNEEELQTFHNVLQEKRSEFYKAQAALQALSWKKETIRQQLESHKKWETEGAELKKARDQAIKEWNQWLSNNHLPAVGADKLSQLQEQWQKIYAAQGKGKIIDVLIEKNNAKLNEFNLRAERIIAATGARLSISPSSIATIYEENRNRNLEWQAIAEKNRQHASFLEEKKQLEDSWAACEHEMKTLMDFVHAATPTEFAERVTAHEQHDQLLKDWANIKQDLRFYAGSEEEYKRLWSSLQTGEYDEWMDSYQKLESSIKEGTSKLAALQKEAGALENEILRLAEDESITGKLQERQEIESDIRTELQNWMTCKFTDYLLTDAQKRYETGKRPAVLKQANTFLEKMTNGKYSLSVSDDGRDVELIDVAHNRKSAKLWSSGTGDQVYLAIRLAMALAFGKQVEPLPVVLDDIFVRFDEERQRQTLRFLMELGKEQQIFLFTCHARTMQIAHEVGKELNAGEFIRLRAGKIHKESASDAVSAEVHP